jgi:hypothetical protein
MNRTAGKPSRFALAPVVGWGDIFFVLYISIYLYKNIVI